MTSSPGHYQSPILVAISILLAAMIVPGACESGRDSSVVATNGEMRGRTSGGLVIVGGGGTPAPVVRRAIELAGGNNGNIVVLPQASMRAYAGDESADMFRKAGAANVHVLRLADSAVGAAEANAGQQAIEGDAIDPSEVRKQAMAMDAALPSVNAGSSVASGLDEAMAILNDADLIWFPGGDQNRLMRFLNDAGLSDLIRERHRNGCAVGGTSAGAAVMSERMITGDADLESISHGGTELAGGLGLWPGVIVDQHFQKRRRFNRLCSAVLDHPALVGVGIDERTAVIVLGDACEVLGDSSAMIIDARRATVVAGEQNQPAAASKVQLNVFAPGSAFQLTTSDSGNERRQPGR